MDSDTPQRFNSHTTRRFREAFARLSDADQQAAREAYPRWRENPFHMGLRFHKIHSKRNIWSVSAGIHCRAIGVMQGDTVTWLWIGRHAEYDKLLQSGL